MVQKVLIITYYWPPSGGAGVQRWLKFVKYMRSCGMEPIVYTAENGEIPVEDPSLLNEVPIGTTVIKHPIWEPYSIYKKFIGRKKEDKINAAFLNEGRKSGIAEKVSVWIRGNFFIPDARKYWIKPSISKLSEVILSQGIDVIISSGPPHSMHLIARGLKKKFPQVKWMADFRDPWTQIDFYDKLMLTPLADRKHHTLEAAVLLEADRILSIGQGMSEQLVELYKKAGGKTASKFHVIPNGFDTADVSDIPVQKDQKFTIAHIGTFVKDRNANDLWQVLNELVTTNPKFASQLEIKLVGKVDQSVKEALQSFHLEKYVRFIPYLPHNEVISEQQKSHVLLLPVNRTPNALGILTGKFFEYMAAGVPVLAIGPTKGDLAKIIQETNCGIMCEFEDLAAIKEAVLGIFNGHQRDRNEVEILKYSRKGQTEQLCALISEMVRQPTRSGNQ